MGSIKNLTDRDKNVHLLYTNSNLAELHVYDTLKEKCKGNRDSIYDINTSSSINEMLDLVNTLPFVAEKWLFVIDYRKAKSVFRGNRGIFESSSAEFLIKVKNYKEYKEVKEMLAYANDIYLSSIRYYDIEYLLKDYPLPQSLIDFIARSYMSDPEQIFVLRNELKTGRVVETRKEIVEICGVSTGSIDTFALSLLNNPPKTDRGKKMVYKSRLSMAVDLADTYGFTKMRNFLLASVKDILDIKELYMVGAIYDTIRDLPDKKVMDAKGNLSPVYDEKRLSKYNSRLKYIIEIPYLRVVRLYLTLKKGGRWFNAMDMVNFMYQYYEEGDY